MIGPDQVTSDCIVMSTNESQINTFKGVSRDYISITGVVSTDPIVVPVNQRNSNIVTKSLCPRSIQPDQIVLNQVQISKINIDSRIRIAGNDVLWF